MNRQGGLSLRATLMTIAAVGALYVAAITLLITFRVGPAARSLEGHTVELIALHDEASRRVRALKTSIAVGINALRIGGRPGGLTPAATTTWRRQVGFQVDSVAALLASRHMTELRPENQRAFGRAAEAETEAGLLLFEAATALELGERAEAARRLVAADSALVVTAEHLEGIQRQLIEEVSRREGTLVATARVVGRAVYWWLGLGLVLFTIAAVIVDRRLRRPLVELEAALVEVGQGNFRAQARPWRRDELGRLAAHFNTMTEVLRERAEEERQRRDSLAERLAQVFDEASDGIYVFDADSLEVLQANRGLRANLGYSPERLIQLGALDLVVPGARQELHALLGQLRRGIQERAVLATFLVRADSSTFPVELSLRYSGAGAPPVFVAVAEDMSPRERTYELNEQLRRFALEKNRLVGGGDLGQALPELTQLAAEALRVERVSVWEYSDSAIRLLDLFERTPVRHERGTALSAGEYPRYFEALAQGEPIAVLDVREDPRTADLCPDYFGPACVGGTLDIPVFAGGKLRGVVCAEHTGETRRWAVEEVMFMSSVADLVAIAMEAADRSRAEAALRESETQLAHAQKMDSIGRLAGGVAHDFNNLLTAIMGHLELARWESPPESEMAGHLREIEHAARRAGDLTRQLLTFARRQVVEPRVVDLNELTRNTDRMLRRLIGADIELVAVFEPDLWRVRLDPGQFEQVIVNLAVNARDAMPSGGKLTIATRNRQVDDQLAADLPGLTPGPCVEILVKDTGRGISHEVVPRIFEPFFTTKELGRGTGLGLATCYGIVRQAGGDIAVESEPGKGTSFRIYLPRTDDPLTVHPSPEPHPAAPPGRETILLVEDEPQVRELTAGVLRAQGYEVLTADDGAQGLVIGRTHAGQIDLLLSDMVMPLLGGRELAAMLQEEQPSLACLLMSGYTPDAAAVAQLDRNHQAFIAKPFTLTELARRVREVLDRRRA